MLQELSAEKIQYVPVVFSCYGRPHRLPKHAFACMADRAARRRGFADGSRLLLEAMSAVGVQIWHRAASMLWACRAEPSLEEIMPLFT